MTEGDFPGRVLEGIVAETFADTSKATCRVVVGRPFEQTIHEVQRSGVELVLVGVEACGTGAPELDSEVQHLVRHCPCPVRIDRAGAEPVRRLLVAVDLEPAEESLPTLSAELVRLGRDVATVDSADLQVVHCWELYREKSMMRLAGDAAEWLGREAQSRRAQRLQSFLGELDLGELEVHLENGRPEDVVPLLVQREKIDLLILGSVTRSGVSPWRRTYTFVISRAHERLRRLLDNTSLSTDAATLGTPSGVSAAFRRLPRAAFEYQPQYRTCC